METKPEQKEKSDEEKREAAKQFLQRLKEYVMKHLEKKIEAKKHENN